MVSQTVFLVFFHTSFGFHNVSVRGSTNVRFSYKNQGALVEQTWVNIKDKSGKYIVVLVVYKDTESSAFSDQKKSTSKTKAHHRELGLMSGNTLVEK